MNTYRVLWTPYPYTAGFCITDDTDNSPLEHVRLVYDFLTRIQFPVTKTVWVFPQTEPGGIPHIDGYTDSTPTLSDREYKEYCHTLQERGFEIALHGATCGNDVRERIYDALQIMNREFDGNATYIQHMKSAENLYYEEKVVTSPLGRMLINVYSRHQSFGEVPGSPYFWGDLCREHVTDIRLFRTRKTNTLSVNPAMPYYDPNKPYVRGWFSATRRMLADCATPHALQALKAENGLTVLYQYLARYADPSHQTVTPEFRQAAEIIANDPQIWTATTKAIMQRRRLMQRITVCTHGTSVWIANANTCTVQDIQIEVTPGMRFQSEEIPLRYEGNVCIIPELPPQSILALTAGRPIHIQHTRTLNMSKSRVLKHNYGAGTVYINASHEPVSLDRVSLPPMSCIAVPLPGLEDFTPMSIAPVHERSRLAFEQMWAILHQILVSRRSWDTSKYILSTDPRMTTYAGW